MKLDRDRMFSELEPPPGGAERFRRRLDDREVAAPSTLARYVIAGVAVSTLAVAAIAVLSQADDGDLQVAGLYEAPEFDRLLGRPMQRADLSVAIDDEPVAIAETSSPGSKIRIYEIRRD